MPPSDEEIAELKLLSPEVGRVEEAGCTYFLLPLVHLPDGCVPSSTDVLLCPTSRDGYASRLFLAERIESKTQCNWQATVRIAERSWHVFSWKVAPNLRLAQMVAAHLRALR